MFSFSNDDFTFAINKLGTIKNLAYHNQPIFSEINFVDHFYDELEKFDINHSLMNNFNNTKQNFTFIISKKSKRKQETVFLNPEWKNKERIVKINFVIKIMPKTIIIECRYYGVRKTIFWGLTNHFILDHSCSYANFSLWKDKKSVDQKWSLEDVLKIKTNQGVLDILSSYHLCKINDAGFAFSPLLEGKDKLVKKEWIVKRNNKNYQVIKLIFP